MSKPTTVALVISIGLAVAPVPTHAEDEWVAVTEHVQCVLDHAQGYRDSGQDVLMIVLSACPEPDINKALASLTKNSAVPGIAVTSGVAQEQVDDVIVYTPDELSCIAASRLDLSGPVTRLPKKPHC